MGFRRSIDMKELQDVFSNNIFLVELKNNLINKGKALLAFRNDEATIYYKGNNLCSIRKQKKNGKYDIDIYSKFLPLSRSKALEKTNLSRYTEKEWQEVENTKKTFLDVLPEIKDNIEKDANPEAKQVSNLYKYSPLAKENNEIVLLDIEAEFEGIEIRSETKTLLDRIDVVLYHTVDKRLIFLEVKRLDDPRFKMQNGSYDKILSQLEEYDKVLKDKSYIDNFNTQYTEVIKYYNRINPNFKEIKIENPPLLGFLLVEFNNSDKKCISEITKAIKDKHYVVCSIGNTEHLTPKTLKEWYRKIKQ